MPSAPVLSLFGPNIAAWSYSGANPTFWDLFESLDGGDTWSLWHSYPGTVYTSSTSVDSGALWYVVGTDAGHVPETLQSNQVSS
jgi:hypothetical protein